MWLQFVAKFEPVCRDNVKESSPLKCTPGGVYTLGPKFLEIKDDRTLGRSAQSVGHVIELPVHNVHM